MIYDALIKILNMLQDGGTATLTKQKWKHLKRKKEVVQTLVCFILFLFMCFVGV